MINYLQNCIKNLKIWIKNSLECLATGHVLTKQYTMWETPKGKSYHKTTVTCTRCKNYNRTTIKFIK